jgi:phage N-6-adenine-methyltransferase
VVFGIVTPQNSNTPEDERDLYQTPLDLFEGLNKIYGPFRVDGAANVHNHLLPLWMGPGSETQENALLGDWDVPGVETKIFINPPWSRGSIYSFVRKAHEQHAKGTALATLLLPATTDVAWFHDFVWDSRRQAFYPWLGIFFITPRVRYVRPNGEIAKNPGMGSMVVSFRSWNDNWNLGGIDSRSELLKVYGDILERVGIQDGQGR